MKKIITKFIANTITKDELNLLYKWLENVDNQSKFEKYILDYHDLNMATLKNDVYRAYENVKKGIDKEKNTVKVLLLYRRNFVKYAAAILVLISFSFFYLTKNTFNKSNEVSISPGTDKATLTLADGSQIILDSVVNYQDIKISSTAKEIIYKAAETKAKIIEYNYLTIPSGGQYHVVLSDETEVWLNSESQLKYPVNFLKDKPRVVELVYGEAYFEVSPSTNHQGTKFNVVNRSQTIEVLGTKFNIKAYKDEANVSTTLVEGSVSVTTKFDRKLLTPNQKSIFSKEDNQLVIHQVEANSEIAWIHGAFVFKKKTLKDISKVLSRWYDVDFEFSNDDIANQKFNGDLNKNQNLESILLLIQNTNKIKSYEIKNKSVLLK
ncbi:FecR family protein [Polaribacter sp. HaHaR_3_91]|uniref:FecR family protein n=1 Tax=Polaribacter sp. HaHaR_3_91 TaxID=2745561 RepID=UPI001C4FC0F2|nr:FecR family protein [Polaribacter sp. HaHaR_3_91]QXP64138.1 FecR family protein [Polaribacter sp. HaHaR_3_91]